MKIALPFRCAVTVSSLLIVLISGFASANTYDLVIQGGRVIDPETQLDAVRNIGINDDRIVEISGSPLDGDKILDASGLVVSPGFIDLHVHGMTNVEQTFQAYDGVTTALELEGGIPFLRSWYKSRENNAIIHYGASVAWSAARYLANMKIKSHTR